MWCLVCLFLLVIDVLLEKKFLLQIVGKIRYRMNIIPNHWSKILCNNPNECTMLTYAQSRSNREKLKSILRIRDEIYTNTNQLMNRKLIGSI